MITMQHASFIKQNGSRILIQDDENWFDPRTPILEYEESETRDPARKTETNWSELNLSGVGIRTVSPEIKQFSHITALYLANNKLRSVPPEIFHELRLLTTLDLSFNQIARLPSGIGQLQHLETILLQENRLIELPIEMGLLMHLKEINVDGNPLSSPPPSITQGGAFKIITYLRERMPMGPPPDRKFISYLEPNTSISDRDKFKVLSYNVLAESYVSPDRYFYCPSWALDWNYRKQGILKEMLAYDCDILCLQEVEAAPYHSFFQPEMSKLGYSGVLLPKSRARTMDDWGSVDGCAIFYKRNKFILVEEHHIEFQTIAMNRHKEITTEPEVLSRIMTKDNVGIAAIFQLKDEPNNNNRGGVRLFKPRHILVCNTHIHWNPEHCDVKLIQVQMLLEQLAAITTSNTKWHKIPMVVCGDFNSQVGSGPYDLLRYGRLRPLHPDLQNFNYGAYSGKGMSHPLQLSSAYAPIGEPPFTNYTHDFVGVLDYLWYSHDSMSVSKVLQPVDEEAVRNTRLPNAHMNSDHISILAEFFFKKR